MTISYSGNFFCLLFRCKGSIWKAVGIELVIWLILFYALRFALDYGVPDGSARTTLINITRLFDSYLVQLPVEILLGFYVMYTVYHWWCQVQLVPKPDEVMSYVNAYIPGMDNESKLRRHAIARYLVLSQTLALRLISKRVQLRFPTLQQVIESGLMTKAEFELYESTPCKNMHWQLPLIWAVNGALISKNHDYHGKVSKSLQRAAVDEVKKFRNAMHQLFVYDWICVPLIYTQVVSYVVYGYFLFALIGHQHFGQTIDVYVPFLTIIQFLFYVGWFKVAEYLARPFGQRDDDLELNIILDRNASVAMSFADHALEKQPALVEDEFFGQILVSLPYTRASLERTEHTPKSHVSVDVPNPGDLLFTETKSEKTKTGKRIPGLQKLRHPLHF